MPPPIIIVDRPDDYPWPDPAENVMSPRDYIMTPASAAPRSTHVINLCRDYSYLSHGYYCSLLAEARGQRIIPSVEVMLDLHWKRLLRIALPEVNELVKRTFKAPADAPEKLTTHIFFGAPGDPGLKEAARRIFELFRCPLLAIELQRRSAWEVTAIRPMSIGELKPEQRDSFREALDRHTRAGWRSRPRTTPARYYIAILHAPDEKMPPSDKKALQRFVRAGASMGVDVELITKDDYGHLPEYDALFIRETTALDHHTYRFAKKAESEGMPVIDDTKSILRCTNKIYLAEILQANNVPVPRTLIVDRKSLGQVESELGFPAVLKIPDSSFSRGVFKVQNRAELEKLAVELFDDTDLVIAQEFVKTDFDWRIGVLNQQPIFVCQYFMARGHWQIVKHGARNGSGFVEGAYRTLAIEDAPPLVIETAVKAANLIGDGFYGVDLKETDKGVFVVEVNDNPSIESGVEDGILKDKLYTMVLEDLIRRLEKRMAGQAANGRNRATAQPAAGRLNYGGIGT